MCLNLIRTESSFNESTPGEKNPPGKVSAIITAAFGAASEEICTEESSITESDLEALVRAGAAGPSSDFLSQVMKVSGCENTLSHAAVSKFIWRHWRKRSAFVTREAERRQDQGTSRHHIFNNNPLQFIRFYTDLIDN